MKAKYTIYCSLILVVFAHAGALVWLLAAPVQSQPVEIIPPTIQGAIISVAPPEPPSEPIKLPEPKPLPIKTSQIPVPKAPPSERAIQAKPEPVVTASEEPKPVEAVATPITQPRTDASNINNPAPIYPALSRRLHEEGVVLLEVLVLAKGTVGELHLKRSSGYSRLDETAIRAVKNWHFVPAKRGAEAIDFWYELPIEFSLNK